MPIYHVTDSTTGQRLKLTGEGGPPTDEELIEIFSSSSVPGTSSTLPPNVTQEDIASLRSQFTGLSKSFVSGVTALNAIEAIKQNTPSVESDTLLIHNFMKTISSDFENISALGAVKMISSFAGESGAAARSVLNEQTMSPEQRQDFIDTATRMVGTQIDSHLKLEDNFRGIAKRFGIDPAMVVIDFLGHRRPVKPSDK